MISVEALAARVRASAPVDEAACGADYMASIGIIFGRHH